MAIRLLAIGAHIIGPNRCRGVEHLADQDEHPVEEDLRQAVAGEGDDRVALRGEVGPVVVVRRGRSASASGAAITSSTVTPARKSAARVMIRLA